MTSLWQMSKQMLLWMLGQPEVTQCKYDWLDDEENELEESSGIGTLIAICMALVGLGFGAYLIPSPLTQSTRSTRRGEQQPQQQQQQQQRERERERQREREMERKRRSEMKLKLSPDPFEDWQDVLLPLGEEVSWLLHAQQHNLRYVSSDRQQLLQLQQQLLVSLSQQQQQQQQQQELDKFYDLPSDESDDDQYKDPHSSSQSELDNRIVAVME